MWWSFNISDTYSHCWASFPVLCVVSLVAHIPNFRTLKLFEMVTEKYPSLTCKSDVMPLIHAWSVWCCVDQGHAKVPERTMKGNAASTDNYTY